MGYLVLQRMHSCLLFSGYFFIVCYYLKIRLNSIKIELNILRTKSKSLTSNAKILMIRRFLEDYDDLFQKIYIYNKYWKKYLTITFLIFVSIIYILTYIVFISCGLKLFVRLVWQTYYQLIYC